MNFLEWRPDRLPSVCHAGLVLAVVAFIALAVGCDARSQNVKVRGTVTLDGKPLEGGVVQFHPPVGQVATGELGPGGTFVLSTHTPGDGVPAGTYRVTVAAYDPAASVQTPESLVVPLRYTRSGASGLQVTIFPDTKAPVKIELISGNPATSESRPFPRDAADETHGTPEPAAATVTGDEDSGSSRSPLATE